MTRPGLIDRRGLVTWACSIGARSELPRLIRRLVLETTPGVTRLGFPADEGVAAGGWDGTVVTDIATTFVPVGFSTWELSVNQSPGTKADNDYAKRTAATDESFRAKCTYVQVSLRPWPNRSMWAEERAAEGKWKEVRAFGVDDVDTWLESAPVTHTWLSEVVGLHPYGLVTPDRWWQGWSSATYPALPPAVVTAGRETAVETLRERCAESGQLVSVLASSRDEIVALVSALALGDAMTDGGALLARTILVDDVIAWRRLRDHPSPLVLIALNEKVAGDFASGSRHTLIVPVTEGFQADIELGPIDSPKAADVLEAEGLEERKARDVGRLARVSLLAARRQLAVKPELLQPAWARSPVNKTVRRLCLVGRWSEESEADREVISQIAGAAYDDLREQIAALAVGEDPFLARLGGEVAVISRVDAWLALSGAIRKDDLDAVGSAVAAVLSELDPALELPIEDRWRASLVENRRAHSPSLRRGLASTLALLGTRGSQVIEGASTTGEEWAIVAVRNLLRDANADESGRIWCSLEDIIPAIAEAAPGAFLDALRQASRGPSPLILTMFNDSTDQRDILAPTSPHVGLLSAIENCVWSPDFFGVAVEALGRLAEIDPGGRTSNRPLKSLVAVFLPWYPQNSVSVADRLAAIDGLRERHPEVSWRLLLHLPPDMRGIAIPISEPRYREWKPATISVPTQEYWTYLDEICARIVADVNLSADRWVELVEKIDNLTPAARSAFLVKLNEASDSPDLASDVRQAIWEALRGKAAQHREFSAAKWALPSDVVDQIEEAASLFQPSDPISLYGWLFASLMPEIPGIQLGEDHEAYTQALDDIRRVRVVEIADATDWAGLRGFAVSVDYPGILGGALADAERTEYEGQFLELLLSVASREVDFATGYLAARFRTEGWPWLDTLFAGEGIAPEQAGALLRLSNDYPAAWERAEAMGEETAGSFWTRFSIFGLGPDFAHVEVVAEHLLGADRPGDALDIIALYLRSGKGLSRQRAELVVAGLDALLRPGNPEAKRGHLSHHDLTRLFEALEDSEIPEERLAGLEWAYLPVFEIDREPKALSRTLSRDPDVFVDAIKRMYRPCVDDEEAERSEPEPASDTDEDGQAAALASNLHHLLSEWKVVPGSREDGTIDSAVLGAWVASARTSLAESGHLSVGDIHIGHVLAWGPTDSDGSRPCAEIRNLLEELQSPDIEDGLAIELENSLGGTSRSALAGGDQERLLAEEYKQQADRFAARWPATAKILRDVSRSLEHYGRWFDDNAERHLRGLDR